jgi:hypothetical protein
MKFLQYLRDWLRAPWKRKPYVTADFRRFSTGPVIWHPGDAIAIVVALALFAIICGGRCG